MLNRIPRRLAFVLLVVYVLMTGTLDLYHNHSVDVTLPGDPAVSLWTCCDQPGEHDPCPVLLFSLSHSTLPPTAIDALTSDIPLFRSITNEPRSHTPHSSAARDPPQ
ncbi:hypothetical protein GF324_06530 [bacterium]|nr:hypothetical protein [bacterium]